VSLGVLNVQFGFNFGGAESHIMHFPNEKWNITVLKGCILQNGTFCHFSRS